jgi:plastocyanin
MKRAAVGLALVLASAALGACGDSPSAGEKALEEVEAEPVVTSQVSIEAHWTKTFSYTSPNATGEAGTVGVGFTNPQKLEHDLAVENTKGEVLGQTEPVSEGSDTTVIDLKPGTYTFYCTFPGHREKGMEGTLTIK